MYNYKLIIEYDGLCHSGWQRQGNTSNTIQEILESSIDACLLFLYPSLSKQLRKTQIYGSGRTDSGVSARGQVANFKCKLHLDTIIFMSTLNNYLKPSIRIISMEEVPLEFHSRLSAKSKKYTYQIDNKSIPLVFHRHYFYRVNRPLDITLMKKGAAYFLGEHDFTSFCSPSTTQKDHIRTIYKIEITSVDGKIYIHYFGNGFLYNMVRILTGTLIEVGLLNISPDLIPHIIKEKNRALAGPCAPSNALFLDQVYYEDL